MKNTRTIILAGVALIVLWGVVRVVYPGRAAAPASVERQSGSSRRTRSPRLVEPRMPVGRTSSRPAPDDNLAPPVSPSPSQVSTPDAPAEAGTPNPAPVDGNSSESMAVPTDVRAAGAGPGAGSAAQPVQDPLARTALAFVGVDPDAEAYWYAAINDPSLSAHERQDLIEDLNEDGLSDPQHPTAGDLPLILRRIDLIEEVIWDAMDEVNMDAFLEAYKDLVNLAMQTMENG